MFRGGDRLQQKGVEKGWRKKIVCRTLLASPCVSLRESRRLRRRWWNFYSPSYFSSRHLSHKRRRWVDDDDEAQRSALDATQTNDLATCMHIAIFRFVIATPTVPTPPTRRFMSYALLVITIIIYTTYKYNIILCSIGTCTTLYYYICAASKSVSVFSVSQYIPTRFTIYIYIYIICCT